MTSVACSTRIVVVGLEYSRDRSVRLLVHNHTRRTRPVPRADAPPDRQGVRAPAREVAGAAQGRPRGVARGRSGWPVRSQHAHRIRRRRRRLSPRGHHRRGTGQGRLDRLRHSPAQRHHRALRAALRQRRAKARMDAEAVQRRARLRHLHDRARHRFRSASRPHHGQNATATTTSSTARRRSSPPARMPI